MGTTSIDKSNKIIPQVFITRKKHIKGKKRKEKRKIFISLCNQLD